MKSTWHAPPSEARWYCEVIVQFENETDYNYGYSASREEPDPNTVWDLVPEGYTLIEYTVHMTPGPAGAAI